jgi:hypothetical protein
VSIVEMKSVRLRCIVRESKVSVFDPDHRLVWTWDGKDNLIKGHNPFGQYVAKKVIITDDTKRLEILHVRAAMRAAKAGEFKWRQWWIDAMLERQNKGQR